jgi:myo-inositol-1(or 4)-monophosphatase
VGGAATGDRGAMSLLEVAVQAAQAGADVLVPRFGRELALAAKSTPTDLVSEADLASERAIRGVIAARRPDDGVLGEEGTGDLPGTTGLRWVVDPLDGTIDYLYGIPQWCVSVAVEDGEGNGLAGVVLDPLRGELWTAERGAGAALNGVALALPDEVAPLERALIATGFGYDAAVREAQGALLARLLPAVRDIRRAGAAALDLVWTAAGRHDAYYEFGVKHWDWAAAALICREAGRVVVTLPGSEVLPQGLAAGPQPLLDALLDIVGQV